MIQVIIPIILSCLHELSDINYQKKVWLASSGPEISSFAEAVCQLFDDSGLGVALESSTIVFTDNIDKMLQDLQNALSTIDDMQPPSNIIESPKMKSVRKLAKELYDLLSKVAIS